MSFPIHKILSGSGSVVTRTERGFQGLDPGGCGIGGSMSRAADALNLIWDGEALRRRPDCVSMLHKDQPVYGIYYFQGQLLIHSGNQLLLHYENLPDHEPVVVYSNMNNAPSQGVIRRQKMEERCCLFKTPGNWAHRTYEKELLFICDGRNFLFYDGFEVHSCMDDYWGAEEIPEMTCFYSTVPETVVAKLPNAGGGDVDPRGDNRLSQFRTESFCVTEETNSFILSCPLSAINTKMPFEFRLRDTNGVWRSASGFSDYSFTADPAGTRFESNRRFSGGLAFGIEEAYGRIMFYGSGDYTVAMDGMDNLTITYGVIKERPDAINGATAMGLFGADGGNNVLFLGGSLRTPGIDYFSAPDDFLCFYETSYEQLGNINRWITGYCPLKDGRMAVLKNDPGEAAVYYRSHKVVELGKTLSGEPYLVDAYPSVAGAPVEGCVDSSTVGRAGNEPCFLTASGLYTVRTVSDELINLNETVPRSLPVEEYLGAVNLYDACAINWKDYYLLFFRENVLVTDGRIDEEGNYRFMRWKIPVSVSCAASHRGILYLGGVDGTIYQMADSQLREAFYAYWQTNAMEENSGLKMLFQRLELLVTPGLLTNTSFRLIRNGKEGRSRTLKWKKDDQTQWYPIATRFGSANTLAINISFPHDPNFRLWGLRAVYRKGKKR